MTSPAANAAKRLLSAFPRNCRSCDPNARRMPLSTMCSPHSSKATPPIKSRTMIVPMGLKLGTRERGPVAKTAAKACCRKRLASRLLLYREHPVNHLAGKPKVMRRVDHALELGAREVFADLRVARQKFDKRRPACGRLATDIVDEIVRALAAQIGPKPHHDGFRHDRTVGDVEVGAHLRRIDLQAFD